MDGKLPFPSFAMNEKAEATLFYGGLDPETNEARQTRKWSGKCSLNEKVKLKTESGALELRYAARMVAEGDIAPDVAVIDGGYVQSGGKRYAIQSYARGKNPDGSVFSTELYLI